MFKNWEHLGITLTFKNMELQYMALKQVDPTPCLGLRFSSAT